MSSDLKTRPTEAHFEGVPEPPMVAIQRSREAAQRLWSEIGRLFTADPMTPAAALPSGIRARS